MTIRNIFIDFGGVIVRTEDKGPRMRQAEKLGLSYRELEKIIFESESSQKASIGAIPEEDHWQAVSQALKLSRDEAQKVTDEFFAGDRADQELIGYLRGLRPVHKVCLISNAWSGLRSFIARSKFDDIFDYMVISAEVGLMKPDPRIYNLALEKISAQPADSVFIDDVLANVEAARSVGMAGIHFQGALMAMQELKKLLNNHR